MELVNRLNAGEDVEFNSGQLRRALHSYVYTMPYVQSITVLTSSGRIVFDDLLTGYNTKTSWLDIAGGQPRQALPVLDLAKRDDRIPLAARVLLCRRRSTISFI